MLTALTAARLITPAEVIADAVVLVEDGQILRVGSRAETELPKSARVADFGNNVLAPGYVDIHIHGGAGYDVMHADAAGHEAIETLLAEHGVTGYCPTTVTAPLDVTLRALERLAATIESAARESDRGARARPLGIHLEGPFISHAKRGVHPESEIREPSLELFERFWQAARGRIRVLTLAPELPHAEDLIREAVRRGVLVSVGHSNADAKATSAAIAAGARHATHTFNAMRALDHREPGIVGVVLSDDRLSADVIADGIHLDPRIIELFVRAKGEERAVLITDAISATGMPDGTYQLGAFQVEVRGPRCLHEGRLAGSVLTMDRAVCNMMEFTGCELPAAVRMASANPARAAGFEGRGRIAPGCVADMLVLSPAGEVIETIVAGSGA